MTELDLFSSNETFKLNLQRPLAFFDLETTGTNTSTDRIVEISVLKINPDGSKDKFTQRINPEMHIPEVSSKVHGIYDEHVIDEPTFKNIAEKLNTFFGDSDLAGFNSNKFDIPLLMEEFNRAGIDFKISERKKIDVQNIFHKMEPRNLAAAYRFYCNKEIENAHSAEADIHATYEVLLAQIQKYEKLENDVIKLDEFSRQSNSADISGKILFNSDGKEIFNFGKHKSLTVEDVFKKEKSYYTWIMNGDFPQDTKKIVTEIYNKIANSKE